MHNDGGKQVAAFQPASSKTVNGNSASPHCYAVLREVLVMDATAIKTKTEELRGLQTRYEKAIRYSIDLQRAIEYHCRGENVPDRVAEGCPYHAEKLNARLRELQDVSKA